MYAIRSYYDPLMTPNGIGLSPDGRKLYAAETETARLLCWTITGEGEVELKPWPAPGFGSLVTSPAGFQRFDSLAVDAVV